MDPAACYLRFRELADDGENTEAIESLRELDEWHSKGGFASRHISRRQTRRMLDNAVRTANAAKKLGILLDTAEI